MVVTDFGVVRLRYELSGTSQNTVMGVVYPSDHALRYAQGRATQLDEGIP